MPLLTIELQSLLLKDRYLAMSLLLLYRPQKLFITTMETRLWTILMFKCIMIKATNNSKKKTFGHQLLNEAMYLNLKFKDKHQSTKAQSDKTSKAKDSIVKKTLMLTGII